MVIPLFVVLWSTLLIITETETRAAEDVPAAEETAKPTSVDVIVARPPQYLGCYDDDEKRRHRGEYTTFTDISPQKCIAFCVKKLYTYAEIRWSYCFCGDQAPDDYDKRPDNECSTVIMEDDSRIFDSELKRFYSIAEGRPPNYLGCYVDKKEMRQPGKYTTFSKMDHLATCIEFCRSKSYAYVRIDPRVDCLCGYLAPNVSDERPVEECSSVNMGNVSSICGGERRYFTSLIGQGAPKVLGCYIDNEEMRQRGKYSAFAKVAPMMLHYGECNAFCGDKSYAYARTDHRVNCFCGHQAPEVSERRQETDCTSTTMGNLSRICGGDWRNSVYKTRVEQFLDYVGCFADDENRKIQGQSTKNTEMTPQMCVRFCKNMSYMFAAVQAREYCFCGDETPQVHDKMLESDCKAECTGDKNSICGGSWRNSVYRTGAVSIHHEYLGCYLDDADRKLKGGYKQTAAMRPRICIEHCKKKGYVFAGLQNITLCFCGNETMSVLDRRDESECDTTCPGDYTKKCGGFLRNSVYIIEPVNKTNMLESCQVSSTTVNNQRVCAHAVVFEEHFDEISKKKWKHFVQIQSEPSYPFVIYNSSSVNSFTLNNKLVIKPTFLTDDQVRYGDIELAECTGDRLSNECKRKAATYNILPPVQTARLTTLNSFAFRYGKVEIIAKLPLGDWLVPELWLEPKNKGYYSQYSSRRIRIAMSRGNSDLTIHGQDIGCKQLESSVLVSTENNIRTHTSTQNAEDCWYKNYHNYTIIWTPENMIFSIDGGQPQSLLSNGIGTLADIIGYPPSVTSIFTHSSTSKIAPFDTEFYITVGLSAGGILDFPDNSVNRGKPKPWRNFEVKALLNFWRDKNSWESTWQEDTALLQVDYIKVTAL